MGFALAAPKASSPSEDFRSMFERELAYVWRTLRRLGVREPDVEDVCHEAFVAIYRHWQQYDPGRPLRPWLFSFAYRAAGDYRKRAHRRREVAGETDVLDGEDRVERAAARWEARELVERALERMGLEQRAVLILHELDGVSMPEVAALLGIKINTAYSRLRLGRESFATAVHRLSAIRGRP